ncbi:Glutamate--cysteine ligase [Gracilaria domingensis]|nr:Glutamate--cysteine ligase [Gracilaria domingensis]
MGLLTDGSPLSWRASDPYRNRVRLDGVQQFLSVYKAAKYVKLNELKWGDEVEYTLLRLDANNRRATLSLRAPILLPLLQKEEQESPIAVPVVWRPEFARWMIEGSPGVPYRSYAADLVNVERNMVLRRSQIANLLRPGEIVLSLSAFPRIGCGVFTSPPALPFGPDTKSFFTSDDTIGTHPRFPTFTKNIRLRRGRKVSIEVPLFVDENTAQEMPLIPDDPEHRALLQQARDRVLKRDTIQSETWRQCVKEPGLEQENADIRILDTAMDTFVRGKIVMDATVFGLGSSCLQVTIQGRDLSETRVLYDQLAVMAPIMLALTAATPAFRGLLANTDVRWNVISASVDDRTFEEERSGSVPKSRYSSIDCYLSDCPKDRSEIYNDIPIPIDQDTYEQLCEGGVDHLLSQHVAHLFIREPIVIYEEKIEQDNTTSTDHFENIQSTNWNTVRFKPPPPGTDIGWRTEFRSMEVGLTDFENAAFSVFIVLLSRVILAFNLNLYIPMSKVDKNMETAHLMDAVKTQTFYFRKNIFKCSTGSGFPCEHEHVHNALSGRRKSRGLDIEHFGGSADKKVGAESESDLFDLYTLDEILNGIPLHRNCRDERSEFVGLIPLIRGYLDALEIDKMTWTRLNLYLDFISKRASGALCTNASFIRQFIRQHSAYRGDSVVSQQINYDLMLILKGISCGEIAAPQLLGEYQAKCFYNGVETAETMMALMQQEPQGPEGALLHGASMPISALNDALKMIARETAMKREDTVYRC